MTDLSIAWTGGSSYVVYSPSDDGESNAYRVHLTSDGVPTCNCKHGQHNESDTAACKHIREAVKAHMSHPDLEYSIIQQYAGLIRDAETAYSKAQSALQSAEEANVAARETEAAAVQDAEAAEGGTEADDDSDGVVTEATPSDDQQALMDDLQAWFEQAGGFNDFDSSIISLSWVEADGTEGIHVDRQPFDGGYYDDGQWQDQDAFDEHKETVKDTVLSPRDEFEWYGEPDYAWFIAAEDVSEVVE